MRQLRRLLGVVTTTAVIGSTLALTAAPVRAATPDAAINLYVTSLGEVLVDEAHGHLLVSERRSSVLHVQNLEGGTVATVSGLGGIDGLALTPDGTGVYAADENDHQIVLLDSSTLAIVKRYDLGSTTCVRSVAPIGTKVWFSYSCSGIDDPGGIGVIDLAADGTPVALGQELTGTYYGGARLRTSPSSPTTLLVASYSGLSEWDTSSGSLVKVASVAAGQYDLAVTPDGGHVVGALYGGQWHQSYAAADLAEDGRYGDELVNGAPNQFGSPSAVAASSTGLIATGTANGVGTDLHVYTTTDNLVRSYDFSSTRSTRVHPHGLAFDASGGRLYAVTGDGYLRVLHVPGAADGAMTLTPPSSAYRGKAFSLKGRLTSTLALPAGTPITVKRDSSGSTVARATVKTAADGTFTITDATSSRGLFGYTASYAGDSRHQPVSKRVVVNVIGTSTTVTILNSAGPYAYGSRPVLVARLGPSVSKRLSIYVQESLYGSKKVLLKTGTVDSNGELRVAFIARMRTNVTAVFAGDSVYNPRTVVKPLAVLPSFQQRPYGNTGTSGAYALFPHGKTADFLFTLKSWNYATCLSVEGQRYVSGAWRASDTNSCIRVASGGTVLVGAFGTNPAGTRWRLRATFVGDTYNARKTNPWIYYRFV